MSFTHGITRDDVFNAASEIFAAGKNPTQASVRLKLGKGSFSTISKHLAEWRENQAEVESTNLENSEDMPDEIRLLFKRVYSSTFAHAESKILGDSVSVLEQENDTLRNKCEDYEATKAELEGIKFAYKDAMERLDKVTRENEKITKYLPEIERLEPIIEERDRLTGELEGALKLHQLQEEEISKQSQSLTASEAKLNSLVTERLELIKQAQELQTQASKVEILSTELAQANGTIKNLRQQLDTKQMQMIEIDGEVTYLDPFTANKVVKVMQELIGLRTKFNYDTPGIKMTTHKAEGKPKAEAKPKKPRAIKKVQLELINNESLPDDAG